MENLEENGYVEQAKREMVVQRIEEQGVRVNRLEVPFNNKDYLRSLGEKAIRKGLITGYTIEEGRTAYKWDGNFVEGDIFLLRATVPRDDEARTTKLYKLFYDGIGEQWEIPVVYVDLSLAANPDFVKWMKAVSGGKKVKIIEKKDRDKGTKWVYSRRAPYINLMSTHFEPEESPENNGTENREIEFVHFATTVASRSHGVIVPERTNVFIHVQIGQIEARKYFYEAIKDGIGLSNFDRQTLERGKRGISIITEEDF